MLNDQRPSYRWQDHVITPKRAAFNLLATVLIVAAVGAAGIAAGHDPAPLAHAPVATEQASSLAQIVKPATSLHSRIQRFGGC